MLALLLLFTIAFEPLFNRSPVQEAWALIERDFSDKNDVTRAQAVHVLGAIPANKRAQDMAEKALRDPSSQVRAEAAQSLGRMGARSALPELRNALKDTELKVVVAAANSLYTFHDPAAYEVYYALVTGERQSGKGLIATQLDTVRDKKQLEKLAFETGIGFVPFGGMGWQAWKTITADDSSAVKVAAVDKLADDPDPNSEKALIAASNDKKWRVRAAAADAVGRRRSAKLMNTACLLLLDENETVRLQAAAAVIDISAPRPARSRSSRKSQ